MSRQIILESAGLRGARQFMEAIKLIEDNIDQFSEENRVMGYREAFLAAKEMGDHDVAKKYAVLIAETDPDLPSIQPYRDW